MKEKVIFLEKSNMVNFAHEVRKNEKYQNFPVSIFKKLSEKGKEPFSHGYFYNIFSDEELVSIGLINGVEIIELNEVNTLDKVLESKKLKAIK